MEHKRFFLAALFLLFVFIACSPTEPTVTLHPPDWIIGRWENVRYHAKFVFDTDGARQYFFDDRGEDDYGVLKRMGFITEDESSAAVYQLTLDLSSIEETAPVMTMRFERTSARTLDYLQTLDGTEHPAIALEKQ